MYVIPIPRLQSEGTVYVGSVDDSMPVTLINNHNKFCKTNSTVPEMYTCICIFTFWMLIAVKHRGFEL